ncbi:MAG: hypothetical protein LW626_12555 [Verrucomicrobium sp.]|jgi:hypothetical protein|nr:hypothetical protein [Verrucomicrobium sp.]
MNAEQSLLARRRLALGITNVGTWVLGSIAGLGWLATVRPDLGAVGLLGIGVAAVAVQAVFDAVGGFVWMPAPRPQFRTFLARWSRGVLVHALVLLGVGAVAALSLRWTGGFCAGLTVSTAVLALGRGRLHAAISGVGFRSLSGEAGERLLWTRVDDPAFTGGLAGFGPRAGILVPESWNDRLPPSDLKVEIARRRWRALQGLPLRTVLVLLLWNLAGCQVGGWVLNPAGWSTGAALLGQACWMTVWSFLGLLVLPALGRATVHAADRAAAATGLDPSGWIRRFPSLTGEDGNPQPVIETIFYPIPSADRRIRRLGSSAGGQGALLLGDLARSQLYYSVAGLTLLGRAVHCNVGRPALWVFPPSA